MKDAARHGAPADWKEAPRYVRDLETGQFHRVAYRRVEIRYRVGGRGYVSRTRFKVWNTDFETWTEAGEAAAPGETFGQIFTTEEFERLTYPAEGLLPVYDVEKGARRFINLDGVIRSPRA